MKPVRLTDLDEKKMCKGCPFNVWTEESDYIQNMGCLPDANQIVELYENDKGHWKCHSKKMKCQGLKQWLDLSNHDNHNNDILVCEDNK